MKSIIVTLIILSNSISYAAIFGLPKPTGFYGVATSKIHVLDQDKTEIRFGRQDSPMEFMVRFYYPTLKEHCSKKMAYLPTVGTVLRNIDKVLGSGVDKFEALNSFHQGYPWISYFASKVVSYVPGLIATNTCEDTSTLEDKFPVLIYSHGLVSSHEYSLAIIEEIVSHGYVVAAIEHPFSNLGVEFTDGRFAAPNPYEMSQEVYVRAQHVESLLAFLEKNETDISFAKLDLKRVGIFGHSLGGGTALLSGRRLESIRAVGVLEAGDYTDDNEARGLDKPILFQLSSEGWGNPRAFEYLIQPLLRNPETQTAVIDEGVTHVAALDVSVYSDFIPLSSFKNLVARGSGENGDTQYIRRAAGRLVKFFGANL